ncbi:MAG: thiamine pyrophosphate-dependent dehydrogenase E1 component subunit alpha [Candidatus Hodarchaeales archaeon]
MDNEVIWNLYELMLRSRRFEELSMQIWENGYIFGELHLGIGEEAINAGLISQLHSGDAIASDYRSTAPFLMRGIDPVKILLEFLGHKEGLCSGLGGHMHLFSKNHLMCTSGIVGASGPAAVGFALALQYQEKKNVSIAFFGEGAMNQGMLLESMNFASVQNLPVLFVCKDNDWAITTRSSDVTRGNLVERASSLGISGSKMNGLDVSEIYNETLPIISQMRKGKIGPYFVHANCIHKEGHFLGDPILRFKKSPIKEFREVTGPLLKSMVSRKGGRPDKRLGSIKKILSLIAKSRSQTKTKTDPLMIIRKKLEYDNTSLNTLEEIVEEDLVNIISSTQELYGQEIS